MVAYFFLHLPKLDPNRRLFCFYKSPTDVDLWHKKEPGQMERKPIACGNRLPPLSANYPWLVAQNLDGTGDQTFYTIHDHLCHYQSRIPKLLGRLIRGYSHGWVILSNKNMWSVWNPVTSKIINLPPLILGSSESAGQCCLSSPPDHDPVSVLLLPIMGKSSIVFCRLGFKKERLRWTRMPYTRQLKEVIGCYGCSLDSPTSYNGKVYALCDNGNPVIQIDITAKDAGDEVSIRLSRLVSCFSPSYSGISLLKGSPTGLFYITVAFNEVTKKTLGNVYIYKWVMTSMTWEEMVGIKETVFFVDLAHGYYSVYYNHAIAAELGGYIHIRDEMAKVMYSYDVEDKTISVSCMAYPTSHLSLWEGDHALGSEKEEDKDEDGKIVVRSVTDDDDDDDDDDEVGLNESRLLNLPFHVLEKIMERCIGVEYMCFRATCKSCLLAAPLVQWNNKTRLRKYSLVSPWLMVVDKNRGRITFTDPVLGEKYLMKRSHASIRRDIILCSRFGWLLLCSNISTLVFFNPFTNDIHELPYVNADDFDSLCFSAPPTSRDCMVVGFRARGKLANVYVYSKHTSWRVIGLDFQGDTPPRFCFPTFHGRDVYALCNQGEVYVFKNLFKSQGCGFKKVVSGARDHPGGEYFLAKCGELFLLVVVGVHGEYVKVFNLKLNDSCNKSEWEKVECLGRYMIYIDGTTCVCIEAAKAPELENKIFFPRLHSKNGKIVFYSLETCRYHCFSGKNIQQISGVGIKHAYPHAWVHPTWS